MITNIVPKFIPPTACLFFIYELRNGTIYHDARMSMLFWQITIQFDVLLHYYIDPNKERYSQWIAIHTGYLVL